MLGDGIGPPDERDHYGKGHNCPNGQQASSFWIHRIRRMFFGATNPAGCLQGSILMA